MAGDFKQSGLTQTYRQVGPYLSLGIEFVASILLCLFAGRWLDSKLGTAPMLILIGVFVGASVGFYNFFRVILRLQEAEKRKVDREEK